MSFAALVATLGLSAAPYVVGPPSDGYFYEVQPVADHIHLIYRPDVVRIPAEGNVEVIEQADGLVVVDAGGTPTGGRRIVEKIRSFSAKPVKYVIYTHWHGDHHLGAPAFREAWPQVRIVSTGQTRAAMLGPSMDYLPALRRQAAQAAKLADRFQADPTMDADAKARWEQVRVDGPELAKALEDLKITPADLTFEDRLDIPDADAPVQVLFLGKANTDGDAVVWTPRQKVLITGDIVVSPYPYGTDSYPADWVAVLGKLKAYDFVSLIPGHGAVQTDRAYLDKLIALIEDVRAQVAPLAKANVPLDAVRKRVNFDKEYQAFAGDSAWIRFFFRTAFIDSMIANAYKEARGEAITQ